MLIIFFYLKARDTNIVMYHTKNLKYDNKKYLKKKIKILKF